MSPKALMLVKGEVVFINIWVHSPQAWVLVKGEVICIDIGSPQPPKHES